jgi:hypothetical protein
VSSALALAAVRARGQAPRASSRASFWVSVSSGLRGASKSLCRSVFAPAANRSAGSKQAFFTGNRLTRRGSTGQEAVCRRSRAEGERGDDGATIRARRASRRGCVGGRDFAGNPLSRYLACAGGLWLSVGRSRKRQQSASAPLCKYRIRNDGLRVSTDPAQSSIPVRSSDR